ncbi:GNAT family N-acetyltransferase [Nocardiopsis nanhaiensis]
MRVRAAVPRDGLGIADLIGRAAPHFDTRGYAQGHWPDGAVVLVALDAGHVVGVLEGVLDGVYGGPGAPAPPPHGYILAVVVDHEWRQLGVGSALVEAFMRMARAEEISWVFLVPKQGGHAPERAEFFRACGFTPVDDLGEEVAALGRWT